MIGELLAILFLSRDVAHRAHLSTKSYAQHMALGGFYDAIVGCADSIAELYQGRNGLIKEIPLLSDDMDGDIADVLEKHMHMVEDMRYDAVDKKDTPIHNKIDEAVAEYLRVLYKLRNLK